MQIPEPANDSVDWEPGDMQVGCACGCMTFALLMREGLTYILCAQCHHDHTMTTIWGERL